MFDIDFNKRADLKFHVRKFFLHPDYWNDTSKSININLEWNSYEFSSGNKENIPEEKGIYSFVLKPKYQNFFDTAYLFYFGKTTRTLKIRFQEYLDDQAGKGKPRPKVFEMLNLYKGSLYFYFASINSDDSINECEEKVLNTFVPPINTDIPEAIINPELRNIYE